MFMYLSLPSILKNSSYVKDLINRETSKEEVKRLLVEYFKTLEEKTLIE